MTMPAHGLPRDDVFDQLEAYRAHDVRWRDGRAAPWNEPGRAAAVDHRPGSAIDGSVEGIVNVKWALRRASRPPGP